MRFQLLLSLALSFSLLPACDDPDDDNDNGAEGNSGGDEADCPSPITECRLGELSKDQQTTYCETLAAAIDDEPGTSYTCDSDGTFLTVNSTADCIATEVPASCPITVGAAIDCYKAAKQDACAAFAEDGACAPLLSQSAACA